MKYTSKIKGDYEGTKWACEIEATLKNGQRPILEGCGEVKMVAWPTIDGDYVQGGSPFFLMEGSLIESLRLIYYTYSSGHNGFRFGWPKNLDIIDKTGG